jgi:hypothetical protein
MIIEINIKTINNSLNKDFVYNNKLGIRTFSTINLNKQNKNILDF